MAYDQSIPIVYNHTVEIDTTPSGSVRTYVAMNGWESLAEALNEIVQAYQLAENKGFPTHLVTAMDPQLTFAGRRIVGDAGQEYIFGQKWSFGNARRTTMRMQKFLDGAVYQTIIAPCTLTDLTDMNGATTDGAAINIVIRFDGKPTVTPALGVLTITSVAGTAGNTAIAVNPALTGSDTYMYLTAPSVQLPYAGSAPGAGWAAWDGVAEIAATTGNQIGIVEIDTSGLTVKGGIATVTAG